jgi:hypothetical protein
MISLFKILYKIFIIMTDYIISKAPIEDLQDMLKTAEAGLFALAKEINRHKFELSDVLASLRIKAPDYARKSSTISGLDFYNPLNPDARKMYEIVLDGLHKQRDIREKYISLLKSTIAYRLAVVSNY